MNNQELFALCKCDECPLADAPGPVFGTGRRHAKFMMIAEAPGRNEVEDGIPMVGASGQMSDTILEHIDSSRDDIYITNTVLCRPTDANGKDAPPPDEAVAACKQRLIAEIRDADPHVIVTTGRTSTNALLEFEKPVAIGSMLGSMNWSERLKKFIIPTWHPAYVLHSQSVIAFDEILQTYQKVIDIYDGKYKLPDPYEKFGWEYVTREPNIRWALNNILATPGEYAIDTETEYAGDLTYELLTIQITGLAKTGEERTWVFEAAPLLKSEASKEIFRKLMLSPDHTWIFHNAQFDLKHIWHHFGVWPANVEDTMALALCLTEIGSKVGLKILSRQWLNSNFYEKDVDLSKVGPKRPTSKVAPREKLVPYAARDTIYTRRLKSVLEQQVADEGNRKLYERILRPIQQTFAMMEYDGMLVDRDEIQVIKNEWEPKAADLQRQIQDFAREHGFDPKNVIKKPKSDAIDVNSWKQLHSLMFDILGYRTVNGKRSVDKEFFEKYADEPISKLLQGYRRIKKMLSTYVLAIENLIGPDGHIHPSFLLFGTTTGRISIKDPPMQTIPRDSTLDDEKIPEEYRFSSLKKMFPAPEGYVFVEADYRALELYIGYHYSRDPEIIKALRTGIFHELAASKAFGVLLELVNDKQRTDGKRVSYGTMYGITAFGLQFQIGGTTAECQVYIDNFLDGFPYYRDWAEEQRQTVKATGRLETPTGRVRRWSWIPPEQEDHIMNQAINFPNQSLASDLCLLSLIELNTALRERGWGYPVLTVHDSIEFYILKEHLTEALVLIKEIMERPKFDTPIEFFPIEIKVGDNWGNTKEVEV